MGAKIGINDIEIGRMVMKKVLLIGSVYSYGGVGRMIFEFCRNINSAAIQFDFLYYEDISIREQKIIDSYHGVFYKVPRYSKRPLLFYKEIKAFFQTHKYDIIHIHASTAMLIMYALPVWRLRKTEIIFHSHSDCVEGSINKILHCLFRHYVVKYANYTIAVSEPAARFMYGKKKADKAIILKNGIDIEKYEFNEEIRKEIRRNLEIKNNFVLGHVGRFTYSKNHPFIIEVFEQVYKLNPSAKLLLVGAGEDEKKIKQMVKKKNLMESVIFYGNSDCVEKLLCAMDCFVFPSHYEGLGIVVLEAQANGLPVVVSEHVPEEAKATELYTTLSLLNDSPAVWAKTILALREKATDRELKYQDLVAGGYDIKDTADKLERIYLNAGLESGEKSENRNYDIS